MKNMKPLFLSLALLAITSPAKADFGDELPLGMFDDGPKSYHAWWKDKECRVRFQGSGCG